MLELAASVLLIAAIAVLALPTFKDFTPHSEFAEEGALLQSASEKKGLDSSPTEATEEDQPVLRPVDQAKEKGSEQRAAKARNG